MNVRKLLPFWYWLALLVVVMLGLLVAHYTTRSTPDGVAFVVPLLNLSVYWYGVVVMGALLFATWAVSQLVHERSLRVFERVVSAEIYDQPTTLDLPDQFYAQLEANRIETVGELVYQYGLNPTQINLTSDDRQIIVNLLQSDGALLPSHASGVAQDVAEPLNVSWQRWNPDYVWNAVMWALVLGIIGARLYHVLTPQPSLGITPAYYFANPLEIINLRNGGLGIFGAIAGGALGLWIYVRRQGLPLADWLDLGALVGALAQAVGRWANYFNQELFGAPTELPWGIYIDPRYRPAGMAEQAFYHPTFLYESIWSFATFSVLYWLWRGEKIRAGGTAAVYLICYGFGRILLETIRLDSNTTGGIATASLVSGAMITIGVVALLFLGRGIADDADLNR